MEDIAPEVFRQRLLLEGYWTVEISEAVIDSYLRQLATELNLRIYSDPIVYSPGREGKEENQGYDAFVPLIDSGVSAYFWSYRKFYSIVIYTCKGFDEGKAESFTRDFFASTGKAASLSF